MDCRTIESRALGVLDEVGSFVRSRDDAWALPEEAGAFLHALILTKRVTRALELGTSYGYSGLWIGAALRCNGGKLITIDREGRKTQAARENFLRAGLADTIDARTGIISDVLDTLTGPFDFVLIDADKPASLGYFKQLRSKLAPRATVITDNILYPPHEWGDFLKYTREDPRLYS